MSNYYTPSVTDRIMGSIKEIKDATREIASVDFDTDTHSVAFHTGQPHGVLCHYLDKLDIQMGLHRQREADTKKILEVMAGALIANGGRGLPENVEPINQVLKSYGIELTVVPELPKGGRENERG